MKYWWLFCRFVGFKRIWCRALLPTRTHIACYRSETRKGETGAQQKQKKYVSHKFERKIYWQLCTGSFEFSGCPCSSSKNDSTDWCALVEGLHFNIIRKYINYCHYCVCEVVCNEKSAEGAQGAGYICVATFPSALRLAISLSDCSFMWTMKTKKANI